MRHIDVIDYGMIPNVITEYKTCVFNSLLLEQLVSSSTSYSLVEFSSGNIFCFAQTELSDLNNIEFRIDGHIFFSNSINSYQSSRIAMFSFYNCVNISIKGDGQIDGQGFLWWLYTLSGTRDIRPNLIEFYECINIYISDIHLRNSPKYHINLIDIANAVIDNITIKTEVFHGIFPLNTDGIDIAGVNVTIKNNRIEVYDDAIAIKPCRSDYRYCQCSGEIWAYENIIYYSLGLAIGSVPPSTQGNGNCIKDVTFSNTSLHQPLKALYIKTQTGYEGKGLIQNINFENIVIYNSLWWTIYIGPQQMHQPDESYSNDDSDNNVGCHFMYPFRGSCPTNKLVTISKVKFSNITAISTLPIFESPGFLVCDETNPCSDIIFHDVKNCFMPLSDVSDFMRTLSIDATKVVPLNYKQENWTFSYFMKNVKAVERGENAPAIYVNQSGGVAFDAFMCQRLDEENDVTIKNVIISAFIFISVCSLGLICLLSLISLIRKMIFRSATATYQKVERIVSETNCEQSV